MSLDLQTYRKRVFTCGSALLLLLIGAFARVPTLFLHGRIWAEESSVLLARNWHLPFLRILLAPQFGYFSLWNNFWAALAVHVVPLQFAGYLFTGSSVLVLLVTGYLVYQAEFIRSPTVKFFAVLSLLCVTGDTESWLNLINSQFSFGLWSAVLLLSSADRLRWRRCCALALAVFSGPVTVLLAPFYLFRAWRHPGRGNLAQGAIVLAGSAVQIGIALTTSTGNRKLQFTPSILGPVLLNKDIVLPLLGRPAATLASHAILRFAPWSVIGCWVALGGILYLSYRILRSHRIALQLLGIAFWLGTLQILLALGGGLLNVQPGFGERYGCIPNALLMLALIVAVSDRSTHSRTLRILLCCALLAGFVDYVWLPWRVPTNFNAPAWYPQGVRWQQDETVPIKGDPGNWPVLRLPHAH